MGEIREELIRSKIAKISYELSLIEDNLPDSLESFVNFGLAKDGVYKKIEFSVELILDICAIINKDIGLGVPETEDDILNNIQKKKIFSERAIETIRRMKKFRNVLVHKYGEIDDEKAFDSIKEGFEDFGEIIKEIEVFLDKYKSKR